MQTKLKLTAVFLAPLLTVIPFTGTAENAMTFELRLPSYGLYCENQNTDIRGKVKYVIDESGKAVQYSEYAVTADNDISVYIPFISNAYELPKTDITVNPKAVTGNLCYGESYSDNGGLRFYSSDIDGITGTLYTLSPSCETFTVKFRTLENQNFIYRFTDRYTQNSDGDSYIINNAVPGVTYEIFVINGDFTEFESSADTVKTTLTAKDYIKRNFAETENYFSASRNVSPDLLYALINRAIERNINYDFFDFFINGFLEKRINAYKIDLQADTRPCAVAYSMPVDVQTNNAFTPAIYMTEQTAAGNYKVDYTIELNGKLPFIIESSAEMKKQSEYVYTAHNVTDDFYFVFSPSEKPESIYGNTENNALNIVIYVIWGVAVCALIVLIILIILYCKKSKKK